MHSNTSQYIVKTLLFASAVFFAMICFAHAQATTTPNATATASMSATSSNAVPVSAVSSSSSRETGYDTAKQKRLTDLAANISNRIDAATNRLASIDTRIYSRANKIEAQGFTVTDGRSYADQAMDRITIVQNNMKDIDSQVAKTVTSTQPQADWTNIKNTFVNAKNDLIQAKALLLQAVAALRADESSKTTQITSTTTTSSSTASSTESR